MGGFLLKVNLAWFLLKLDFTRTCAGELRRNFRSLTKVWRVLCRLLPHSVARSPPVLLQKRRGWCCVQVDRTTVSHTVPLYRKHVFADTFYSSIFFEVLSTPSVGLELMTGKSRVAPLTKPAQCPATLQDLSNRNLFIWDLRLGKRLGWAPNTTYPILPTELEQMGFL